MNDWLSTLKPGDEVVVAGVFLDDQIQVVERATPASVTTEAGRFSRRTGKLMGRNVLNVRLVHATRSRKREITTRELTRLLHQTPWHLFRLETLEAIYELAKNGQHTKQDKTPD